MRFILFTIIFLVGCNPFDPNGCPIYGHPDPDSKCGKKIKEDQKKQDNEEKFENPKESEDLNEFDQAGKISIIGKWETNDRVVWFFDGGKMVVEQHDDRIEYTYELEVVEQNSNFDALLKQNALDGDWSGIAEITWLNPERTAFNYKRGDLQRAYNRVDD